MARATFVKSAQKTIYQNGKRVEYVSVKGKREGQTLSKIDRTIPQDDKDPVFIAKGESYWWWAFKNGGKYLSKTQPKQSQLTQSNYLGQLYTIQEQMDEIECNDPADIEGLIDGFKSDLENLRDETQGSLDNMPEGLQQGDTGQLLQERIDACENAISEFENIEFDYEEPDESDIIQELKDEYEGQKEETETGEEWEPASELIEERKQEKAQEWIDEKVSEIQSVSLE